MEVLSGSLLVVHFMAHFVSDLASLPSFSFLPRPPLFFTSSSSPPANQSDRAASLVARCFYLLPFYTLVLFFSALLLQPAFLDRILLFL